MTSRRLLLALFITVTCPVAWAQDPVGPEFQVNTYTTNNQITPAVASAANGNFVVVWNANEDGSLGGILGKRFNASGLPQGSDFWVNSYTSGDQRAPAVASDANGNFVVVWQSYHQDGTYWGIFGQHFDASGLPQGSEFRGNSYTTGSQVDPAVASDANGNFVVVWTSYGQDGDGGGVFGQRFNAAGLPQGGEFQVNSYSTSDQRYPAVASDASGNFVVVWESNGQDGSSYGVFGQRFNASGLPQGGEFQVNSSTTDRQRSAAVASDPNGNVVVVWESGWGQDGSTEGVFGQRFNAAGLPQGSEFQVNSYTTDRQRKPAVSSAADGNFVVVWQSGWGQDGSLEGVFGQRFNASGVPQGSEFQVNSYTTSFQQSPAVGSAANGNFVVVWQSFDLSRGGYDILGQRYGDLIFRDGFQ